MTLGQKLQLLRKEKGFSQEKLATELNVSRQAVSKWELDITLPETENIIKIRNIFDVSFDYLMDENIVEKITVVDTKDNIPAEVTQPAQIRMENEYNKTKYIFLMVIALFSGVMVLRLLVPFISVFFLFIQSGFNTSLMSTARGYALKFYTPVILILMAVCALSVRAAVKIKTKVNK